MPLPKQLHQSQLKKTRKTITIVVVTTRKDTILVKNNQI